MNKEERLKRAADDDWGVAETKSWHAEEPLIFTQSWYYSHIYLILYMAIGFGIVMYQVATGQIYRILTIVTWPWLLRSNKFIYLLSALFYTIALILITTPVVKQVRNFPLNFVNIAYFFVYYLGLIVLLARFFVLLITPDPIVMPVFD